MIIKYRLSTDVMTAVKASKEIDTVILDFRREEHANSKCHRYHTAFSFDDMDYEYKGYFLSVDKLKKHLWRRSCQRHRATLTSVKVKMLSNPRSREQQYL